MQQAKASKLTFKGQWFRIWMPYCFIALKSGAKKSPWLPLNRNYKPLGIPTGDWVNYADYESQAVNFTTDPRTFKDIWLPGGGDQLWLYEDSSRSRIDYFQRLEKLTLKYPKLVGPSEME